MLRSHYNNPYKPVDLLPSDLLQTLKGVGFTAKFGYYPTYALAHKWFREVHALKYSVDWMPNIKKYTFSVTDMKLSAKEYREQLRKEWLNKIPRYETYELAQRAAFDYMVEKIMPLQLKREARIDRILEDTL